MINIDSGSIEEKINEIIQEMDEGVNIEEYEDEDILGDNRMFFYDNFQEWLNELMDCEYRPSSLTHEEELLLLKAYSHAAYLCQYGYMWDIGVFFLWQGDEVIHKVPKNEWLYDVDALKREYLRNSEYINLFSQRALFFDMCNMAKGFVEEIDSLIEDLKEDRANFKEVFNSRFNKPKWCKKLELFKRYMMVFLIDNPKEFYPCLSDIHAKFGEAYYYAGEAEECETQMNLAIEFAEACGDDEKVAAAEEQKRTFGY